ncbi:hypothetical protein BV25DRAFT_1911222 [Artomyces pyxidatus]|uniref:Uncharacterized protein n=1 Tax=Artomyces pyxidatus TaxID=48021 RepID=A0ACB8TIJ7_9AGAM|nr:hypothetical protein BV25DRAFT_1911222 [Artomyces pyxidatus]
MFFTPELLSRRDSGFGLLWLAATLGAKSSFKKLPKRDVLGADIAQLCGLIIEPAEPLALRLSSNLMVGVARVYKIKHEIFLGDVTSTFAALKKAVQTLSSSSLEMGQPTVRPDTVTVTADPAMALRLNFDDFLGSWQDFMDAEGEFNREYDEDDGSDDEYGKRKKKGRDGKRAPSLLETARANLHTLNENLEQMLSGSFEASFLGSAAGGQDSLSSQPGDGFGFGAFDDNPFVADDDLGLGDIGDELARELGEGWGSAPVKPNEANEMDIEFHAASDPMDANMDFDQGGGFSFADLGQPSVRSSSVVNDLPPSMPASAKKRAFETIDQGNVPLLSQVARTPTPPWAASEELMNIDDVQPTVEVDNVGSPNEPVVDDKPVTRKPKRVRLLLDARTELTDDELKTARAQYVESQEALRREIEHKKLEKESGRRIEEMLWGVPLGLKAPLLVDFWLENFKVQVEARTGALHVEERDARPVKRRRLEEQSVQQEDRATEQIATIWEQPVDMDVFGGQDIYQDQVEFGIGSAHQRSSEEPGQGRHFSHPSSPLGGAFEFDLGRNVEPVSGSQKSSLFPWDNAGPSSSVIGGAAFDPGSDRVSIGHAEVRIRGSSAGRTKRDSSLGPSQFGSTVGGPGFSPGAFGRFGSQIDGDNFEFDVPADVPSHAPVEESQQSDLNLVTLERNSFNFLEYAKMQMQTLQQPSDGLIFDAIVPKATSTPHVAAAAFYHCLVLATKHLIRVEQPEPYGALKINIT